MVQLHNFFFFITSMVVPRGTAAPVLFQWFVSRDVPTGAPSSNGTIIPIPIPSFPLLVYLHSRKFIRTDGKSGVLVRANRPITIMLGCAAIIRVIRNVFGSSSETRARNALFRFVPVLHFLILESQVCLQGLFRIFLRCALFTILSYFYHATEESIVWVRPDNYRGSLSTHHLRSKAMGAIQSFWIFVHTFSLFPAKEWGERSIPS